MKKMLLITIMVVLCLFFINIKEAKAATSYLAFQEIRLDRGKLLRNFTDAEYEEYYKKLGKRKFMDWNVYYVYKDIRCSFVSKTVFSYYNKGTSKITYTYNLQEVETEKFSISASGSISYSGQGTNEKKFKNGLQATLKLDVDYSKQLAKTTKENLDIVIDPKSVATLKIVGEGRITNGVAERYIFWIRFNRGGFEYFTLLTEYPRLEVLPIR